MLLNRVAGANFNLPQTTFLYRFRMRRPLTVSISDNLSYLFCVVSSLGIEPRTHALKGRCSTY